MADTDPAPEIAAAPSPAAVAPPKRGTTRRNILIGTGAVGGLLLGYAVWPRKQRLNWVAGPDESRINGWLKIGTDGRVIVAVPQAEMGQGVYTALPQILADELGADWNTVGVEPAPLNPVYANRGMAADATKKMPALFRGIANWGIGEVMSRFEVQLTGGSSSVRAYEPTLRLAGAAAREMLCKAAARRWDADWEDLDTANGFVIYKANRIRFADIAGEAAQEDMPSEPTLRSPSKNRLMGKAVQRIDIPAKTNGSARFGSDVRLPGLVYAAVRSGPTGDPALTGANVAAARAVPGVLDVVKGPTWVAVVGTSWWLANNALDAAAPQFAAQPKPAGPWMAKALHDGLDTGEIAVAQDEGDAAALLAKPGTITATYSVPFLAHACLEPMNATARITDGHVEVWAPTQSLTLATWAVSRALGIEDKDVTVYPTLLGGGFGRKVEVDCIVQAALIARATKRPVQLIYSRAEDIAQDKFRPAAVARMRGQLEPTAAGKRVGAWGARIAVPDPAWSMMRRVMPSLASDAPKAGAGSIEGAFDQPYDLGAVLAEHALVDLPVASGIWRSVGHSFTGFFVESFIDELAHAAGADPFAFRLALLAGSPRHAAVLRAVMRLGGPLGIVEPGVARGIAIHESFGSIVAVIAEVAAKPGEITVRRLSGAIDCGQVVNPNIVAAQVEGAMLFGLSAALTGDIQFEGGRTTATNFDGAPLLSMAQAPVTQVVIMPSTAPPGGVGEPGTPPVAPAVANALFAVTGKRFRDLPLVGKV